MSLFSKDFLEKAEKSKIQMAFSWGKEVRVAPNAINRSSIFGVVRRGKRKRLKNVVLATIGETEIAFSGVALDQGDKDVFYELLHRAKSGFINAKKEQKSIEVRFSTREFLRAIDRTESGASQRWLRDSIERLSEARIKIKYKDLVYRGPLIVREIENLDTKDIILDIDKAIGELFTQRTITKVGWRTRLALGSRDTAKWLYDYILSHRATQANPHRIGLQKLWNMSHIEPKELTAAEMAQYKHQIKSAMETLKEKAVIKSYGLSRAILTFVRSGYLKLWNSERHCSSGS